MDDLTIALNKCNTRCVICSTTINHLMYADDLVILSPSVSRLSELMQVCGLYGLNHDIKYNSKISIKWQSRIRRHWIKMLYIHNSFCLNVPLCNVFFIYLPCAILLYFSSHLYFFNVYVDICMSMSMTI